MEVWDKPILFPLLVGWFYPVLGALLAIPCGWVLLRTLRAAFRDW
jgi:hypothetical protein